MKKKFWLQILLPLGYSHVGQSYAQDFVNNIKAQEINITLSNIIIIAKFIKMNIN